MAVYESIARAFLDFLGEKADSDLAYISTADICGFRDHSADQLSTRTANNRLKTIKIAFQQAWRESLITDNPAAKVSVLKADPAESTRRAFTKDELVRLLALAIADGEWKGMILFGLYTAQRLGDIARLKRDSIDLENNTISLVTRKTRRRQIIPIAPPLHRWLQAAPIGERGTPLFPEAFRSVRDAGKVSTLSRQFYDLLARAELVPKKAHRKRQRGDQGQRRVTAEISFHSLRHTATSMMKNAGISPAIVQEFVGHDSKAVSDHYTHIETSALVQATAALPNLLNE